MNNYITCPNCETKNYASEQFCTKCGLWLQDFETKQVAFNGTRAIEVKPQLKEMLEALDQTNPAIELEPGSIGLMIGEANTLLIVNYEKPVLLGRDAGTPLGDRVLVDFNDYRGYIMGVSRQHALISENDQGFILMDLGSSNGTFINSKRLKSNEVHPLKNGDTIILGQLSVRFFSA